MISAMQPNENNQWQAASRETLAKAYGENEPDYCAAMVKESNADYQSRQIVSAIIKRPASQKGGLKSCVSKA